MAEYKIKEDTEKKYVKTPWPVFIFQWAFLGLMVVLVIVELPMGPFGLPWETLIVSWLSFVVLLVTSFIYLRLKDKGVL